MHKISFALTLSKTDGHETPAMAWTVHVEDGFYFK